MTIVACLRDKSPTAIATALPLSFVSLDDGERALADELSAAWRAFARDGALAWPRRTATGSEQVVLDRSIHAAVAARPQCAALAPRAGG